MRTRLIVLTCLLAVNIATGQTGDEAITLDSLVSSAEQWAQENLDQDALRVLQQADRERVQKFLEDFQKEFQGEYVIDLAGLKETARTVIPLLEGYEETFPYALWLKTKLDYLEVADQFRLMIPRPKAEPGQAVRPGSNPPAEKEREIWITRIKQRSYPENAKPYLPRLKALFTSEDVPPELVWLAEVESSFDPRVRSPAGATGLFQLMPATARRYGLRTTWPWDDRLKLEPSARAAAQYLRYLHRRFNDWRLALAAYNAGEGTVQTLLTRYKGHTYDSIAGHLPAETQMYVPKIEATLLRREGVKLASLRVPEMTTRK
jgi:membrane-bound lytic murein transglycosylase D